MAALPELEDAIVAVLADPMGVQQCLDAIRNIRGDRPDAPEDPPDFYYKNLPQISNASYRMSFHVRSLVEGAVHGNAAALKVLDFYLQSARDRNLSQHQRQVSE